MMIPIDTFRNMTVDPQKLYSTKELAGFLNISEITAKRYVSNDVIDSVKIGGNRRIRGSDLKKFLQEKLDTPRKSKGCELAYPKKIDSSEIISSIKASKPRLIKKYGDGKINRLFIGDNLNVLKYLYEDQSIRGKINLIYIDPPFGTGQDFIGHNEEHFYADRLVDVEFLEFLRKRLIFLQELLSENGSIYLHIDNKIGHYVKILMDEVFGAENFRNDITRIKCNPKNFERRAYGNIKDVIYFYSKKTNLKGEDPMFWTDHRPPLSQEEILKQFPKIDRLGRRYATTPLHAKGETKNGPTGGTWKGLKPPRGRHWRYAPKELDRLDKEGLIEWSTTGNPRKIIYAHENRGKKIQDIWDFKDPGYENARYPTEKNEDLLKHIILSSSKEGDMVLDCFSGSGTTLAAAESLNRKWIGVDANPSTAKVLEERMLSFKKAGELFKKAPSFSIFDAAY